ncbi:hypothetical protein HD806DRAFT_540989 [Xylariaceae sp. AK1471]|nr:hypothetical protein HD806DRAFT_540989 [Xylariaceae sp. AK1471]
MADPLSVAGLVIGVISLGLEPVKGRDDELSSSKQRATSMKDLLLTIQDLLPQIEGRWPLSAASIERYVAACNVELGALYALLSELSAPKTSSTGIRLKLAEKTQALVYPFNRGYLTRLVDRLGKLNSVLQAVLQVTQL